jgi:hypothetical protein
MSNHYHLENPESYYECFNEEIEHYVKLMVRLDQAITLKGLPVTGKSKDLFDMVDALMYPAEKRYKKKHNIQEENNNLFFSEVNEAKLIDSMKIMLQEEVSLFFSQNKSDE